MSPLAPHAPLAAATGGAWGVADVPAAFAAVAGEPWVLALVALALYAWLEREVRDVLAAFSPLLVALAACAGLALAARALAGGVAAAGEGQAALSLLWALAGGQAAGVSALAVYSLLAYGRRARAALLFALAFGVARALSGPGWALDLGAGAVLGWAVAAVAHAGAVRLFPAGRLARAALARRSERVGARRARPSP